MMEEDPQREFSAGNVKIDWVKKDNEPKIEETNDDPDEVVEEESSYLPKITARGVDFPMLLHEAVKGLYEILAIGGIPEDEEVAKRVLANTGRMDEPEDWRWGPEIASDFRDFINKNPKVDKYPNIREEFFKLMFDKETMSTEDCLELMRGILSKTEKARKDVDKLIDLVIESIDQYYNYLNDMDKYSQEIEEYNRDLEDFKEVGEVDEILTKVEKQPEIVDYSKMSKYELQSIIDEALDNGDFDTLGKASVYL
jgi:chaperonin cofactor prefoldin